jgi:hypothetical protein
MLFDGIVDKQLQWNRSRRERPGWQQRFVCGIGATLEKQRVK